MPFVEQYAGGECEWPERQRAGAPPRFTFHLRDLLRVRPQLDHMFVELSVRPMTSGGLAFCLDVPDRNLGTWSIPVSEKERSRLARGSGECAARVQQLDGGPVIDLAPFCEGLRHDWTGEVAAAYADLARGDAVSGAARLAHPARRPNSPPSAHHLLGRCHRACEKLEEAIACYRAAVRASTNEDGQLRPWAAGPLSDMGVAYKRGKDAARAIHCFLHSLHLRPNHPEALLSFFSLLALDDSYVLFAASRVLALGDHGALVDQFLDSYARHAHRDSTTLRREAERLAAKVDLSEWPFRRPCFGSLASFERGLAGKATPVTAALAKGRWGPGNASA